MHSKRISSRRGVSLTSYGLVVGLIAIVALTVIQSIGSTTDQMFSSVSDRLQAAGAGGAASEDTGPALPTPTPTFNFTAHTFTTCSTSGPTGPSQSDCRTQYDTSADGNWDEDSGIFTVQGGIQQWLVPVTGSYRIEAKGAIGARTGNHLAGEGAVIGGTFDLTHGDVLKILVGQVGLHNCSNVRVYSGGGGGGSFVTMLDDTPLLIAGGGGGAAQSNNSGDWGDSASTTETGTRADSAGPLGGTAGDGGQVSDGNANNGSSGAGFIGNGRVPTNANNIQTAAQSFLNGGSGGLHSGSGAHGGFGGGGASGGCGFGGGAGGGYSGGGGGRDINDSGASFREGGGGGGSFNSGANPSTFVNPHGSTTSGTVTITLQ
ncbi:MAG: hypothetical protein Alpg2KO_09040 [Alphaproteobacteria bacterium]